MKEMKTYIDLEKLMEFVTKQTKNEQNITTLITEHYPIIDGDINDDMASKETSESKMSFNETTVGIRYDLVKLFLNPLLNDYEVDEEIKRFSIDTLVENGIMIKK
ncbi:MAG: hypothetical protein K2H20_02730 [Bacilli bacterium]|nr:hypothetical protein [Bacilli bacterium]